MRLARPKTDKPCDICGDCSFADVITTCTLCNQVHEHIYCMRTILYAVPDIWFCEECRSRDDTVPLTPKVKNRWDPTRSDTSGIAVASGLQCDSNLLHGPPLKKPKVVETNHFAIGKAETKMKVKRSLSVKLQDPTTHNGNYGPKAGRQEPLCTDGLFKAPAVGKTENVPVAISPPSKPVIHRLSRGSSLRAGEASKVKFIPAEEAMLLTSGSKSKASPIWGSSGSSVPRPFPIHTVPSPVVKRTIASKGFLQKGCSSSGNSQPAVIRGTQLEKVILQPPSIKTSKELHLAKSPTRSEFEPSIHKSLSIKQEDDRLRKPCPADAPDPVLPLMLPLFSEESLPNHPFPQALWKIQAHRPTIVSRKAREVSKGLPTILQLKLQHRCNIWPKIFLKDCPAANDIALYFFSGECGSSIERYIRLVGLIEQHDLAMTTRLDGVELLIFTSKLLPMESQRLNMPMYLWGVFIRKKDAKATSHAQVWRLPTHTPFTWNLQDCDLLYEDCTQRQANISNGSAEVDMEIDMMGGKDVGRIDIPVPRPVALKSALASSAHFNAHRPSSTTSMLANLVGSSMIKQEFPIVTANLIEQDGLSFSDVPPGFLKPVTSEPAEVKPLQKFAIRKPSHVRFRDVPPCFTKPCNTKDDNHPPKGLDYREGKVATRSTKVQSPKKPIIPIGPPGFTKLVDSKDEYQLSQDALGKGKVIMGITEVQRPPQRVTGSVEPPSFREFVDAPVHKTHVFQSLKRVPEPHLSSITTTKSCNAKNDHCAPEEDYREEKAAVGCTEVRSPSNPNIPRFPPGFTELIDSSDECQSAQTVLRKGRVVMGSLEARSLPLNKSMGMVESASSRGLSGTPFHENSTLKSLKDVCEPQLGSTTTKCNAKRNCRPPRPLDNRNEQILSESDEVQCPSKSTICGIPPGFTKLIDSNDEHPSSQAALEIGKDVSRSIEVRSPPSRRETERVGPSSSGALLGTTIHENPTIQSLEDDLELQFDSLTTSYLQLFPENVKAEMGRVGSAGECIEKEHLTTEGDTLILSLSRPKYLKDGNSWISELSEERLKQEGGAKELRLSL